MKIRDKLIELQDTKYKEFNKKLCPDTNWEMLGIRIPILRKLAKEILKSNDYNWKEFVENENIKYYEEVLLQGFIIGYSKIDFNEKLKYIEMFVPRIDGWSISDTFVPTLKIKEKDLLQYWNFILPYTKSEKEFDVRFSIISMLDYFITDEYIDIVISNLTQIKHDGYYVKMAVAWVIAEIGIKYNEKAMKLLKDNNLDKFTHNKAIQKMIESYRISNEQKDILRKMKIK